MSFETSALETPIGRLYLSVCDNQVVQISTTGNRIFQKKNNITLIKEKNHSPTMQVLKQQLLEYFKGQRQTFDLNLKQVGTPFQLKAWDFLANIPYGETCSYAEQAKQIGSQGAARAVGSANAANPFLIVVPCHRVLRVSGDLGGYAGGLSMKKALLFLEAQHRLS